MNMASGKAAKQSSQCDAQSAGRVHCSTGVMVVGR